MRNSRLHKNRALLAVELRFSSSRIFGNIFRIGADELGKRLTIRIKFAKKNANGTQSALYKTVVFNKNSMKTNYFFDRQRVFTRLHNGSPPSFDSISRRPLRAHSGKLMEFIEWEPTAKGNVHVLNDTADLYRYFDCTLKDEELIELEEIVRDAFDGFDLALGANLHSESEK